jgi:hypothetical protein
MATHNSVQAAARASGSRLDGTINGGALRRFRYDIVLEGQASGDTINLGKKPRNHRFFAGAANSDVSLGASTIAIGLAGNAGKYRAAGVHTTPNTPVLFGTHAASAAGEGEEEDLILTVGAASLPGAGNLAIEIVTSEF